MLGEAGTLFQASIYMLPVHPHNLPHLSASDPPSQGNRGKSPSSQFKCLRSSSFSPLNLAIIAPRQAGLTPVVSLSSESACNTTLTSKLLPKKGLGARVGDTLTCVPYLPVLLTFYPHRHLALSPYFGYNYIVLQRGGGF